MGTAFVGLALLPAVLAGCLNPNLVNQNLNTLFPTAPGDEPFLAIRIINDTTATLDIPLVYDDGTTPAFTYLIQALTPQGRETGLLLEWPILRVALGDLDNPFIPAIVAYFPDGSTTGVVFGQAALQANTHYNRGDTVIFHITEDSRSPAYIRVSSGIIDGSTQAGQPGREDPFGIMRALLLANGF
jgi:hypothetical protein